MLDAQLSHNPYLLTTKVKFNGQVPRINSRIEKYENQPLKDWVNLVPDIFYNEMNGYDFDFYFVGTKDDFEEIRNSFQNAGITSDQVRLFHKNEIEDVDTKREEIVQLLKWTKEHPNRRLDYSRFLEEHEELFDESYPYIVIRCPKPTGMDSSISPEQIESIQEINTTNLTNTPILFSIEEKTSKQFRQEIQMLLCRKDIRQEQMFFMIDPLLDTNQITRVISDLGVKKPQIVQRYDDKKIISYIKNYPMTEYVRSIINVFSDICQQIGSILDEENRKSEVTNAEIHKEIDALESDIASLKEGDEFFVQRDNYVIPHAFYEFRQIFKEKIQKWKNRKTKVTGDYEASVAADEYITALGRQMDMFFSSISSIYQETGKTIKEDFSTVYSNIGIDKEYRPAGIFPAECKKMEMPELKTEFLALKEITYEESKNDFFGLFKKAPDEYNGSVRVVTCYLEQWRNKAMEILLPLADDLIQKCKEELINYYDVLANGYHQHLRQLIMEKNEEKERVSARLSDDERRLQEDNDWLNELRDQLQKIERD